MVHSSRVDASIVAWWQNVPSEYRKYITIDEKRTAEFDFSQLNPHLLYHSNYKELGSEDAYDRVLDGEHRKIVKQAFNAMVQASTPLKSCPRRDRYVWLGDGLG